MKANELREICKKELEGPRAYDASSSYITLDGERHDCESGVCFRLDSGLVVCVDKCVDGLMVAYRKGEAYRLDNQAGKYIREVVNPYESFGEVPRAW